jgi:hypothetical protein
MTLTSEINKPQIITHIVHSVNYTCFDTKWIPGTAKFVVIGQHARGTGAFEIFELGDRKVNKTSSKENPTPFKCCTFGASNMTTPTLATGDFNGTLAFWELENISSPVFHVKAHEQIINCIDGFKYSSDFSSWWTWNKLWCPRSGNW